MGDHESGHHHHDHGFDHDFTDQTDRLSDPARYRYLSAEEVRTFLDPRPDWVVADLGSGTGFYTDDVASVVDTVYAVDAYAEMHEAYEAKPTGKPDNVVTITADVGDVPLDDSTLDGATSLRTFHHGVAEALPEVYRLLKPGGRFVVVDWSATGAWDRERGPDPEHCYDLATVQSMLLDAGFRIQSAHERRETFVVVATRRGT